MRKIHQSEKFSTNKIDQLKELREAEIAKLNARKFEDMDDAFSNEDQAELMEENAERAAGGEVMSETLEKIEMAIAWAEAGQEGICFVCGNQIEEDRLAANPTAITCKSDLDHDSDLNLEKVQEKIDNLH